MLVLFRSQRRILHNSARCRKFLWKTFEFGHTKEMSWAIMLFDLIDIKCRNKIGSNCVYFDAYFVGAELGGVRKVGRKMSLCRDFWQGWSLGAPRYCVLPLGPSPCRGGSWQKREWGAIKPCHAWSRTFLPRVEEVIRSAALPPAPASRLSTYHLIRGQMIPVRNHPGIVSV